MTPSDLRRHVKLANHIKKSFDKSIWKKDICFYLDGKGFAIN